MGRPQNKRRSALACAGAASEHRSIRIRDALPFPIRRPDAHPLALLAALALAFALSQGCAAVGVALLGSATSAATGTSVSYTLDSKAQKSFTAPIAEVKTSLVSALDQMAFAVDTEEKTSEGERIVARGNGREVEAQLESVTPKTTRMTVVVREGVFWKDRATAVEIVEQTSRGVDVVVLAARVAAAAAATHKTPADEEPRPSAAVLEPWDPQRWRAGFAAGPKPAPAPVPAAEKVQSPAPIPEPAVIPAAAAPAPMVALGGGRSAAPESDATPETRITPASLVTVDPPVKAEKPADGADNRWRVIRKVRLRSCPGAQCGYGASLKKGDVVVRLREQDRWWRVWLAGTDVAGWVLATDLAPQRWWDPPKRPVSASAQ